MKKLFGLMQFVDEGSLIPKYHGLVYRDFFRRGIWVAPLGMNVVISIFIQALTFIRFGFFTNKMNDHNWYQQGFDAGVKYERDKLGLDK